ncbi:hypothetical protein G7072_12480 [Nocardioides sp. HDW12B]|uniref:hypothetical protein n=1 Tax=Nocardioides sp. HDW12B TaxID=2714939 RepID=UPI0014094A21|nr:hypothetical protein [Nocardioides sp. HDW12B]QIK67050.1 hypothetical protein G7072_12480 [Nocardioides sp. HDW12B]
MTPGDEDVVPRWFPAALATSYAVVLGLTVLVVTGTRPPSLVLLGAGLLALVVLGGWRLLARRGRGRTLVRARPTTPVPRRFAARARITATSTALVVHNGSTRRWWLPGPGRSGAPVALRPGRLADPRQGPVTRLALVDAEGAVLLHLARSEWCADGAEPDLADALGLVWDPAPVPPLDTVAQPSVGTAGAAVLDPQPLLVPGLLALWVTLWALGDDDPASRAAVVVGAVAFLLGPVGFFWLLVRATWLDRRVTGPR